MLKLITKPACPMCVIAKNELKKKGIEFETLNFDDQEAQKIIEDNNIKSMPIICDGNDVYCGADAVSFVKKF